VGIGERDVAMQRLNNDYGFEDYLIKQSIAIQSLVGRFDDDSI